MFTDEEALRVPLKGGFLYDYVHYAKELTSAPICYHVACGLSALALCSARSTATLQRGLYITSHNADLKGNLFTLLIGKSGDAKKSTAINTMRKILRQVQSKISAGDRLVGDIPGSPQGFVKSLSESPNQMIIYSEFGSFLSQTALRSNQLASIRELYGEAYDGTPLTKKLMKDSLNVVDPRLSMVVAATPVHLEEYTKPVDWEGGFLNRFLMVYGEGSLRKTTNENPVAEVELGEQLWDMREYFQSTKVSLTSAATEVMDMFQEELRSTVSDTRRITTAVATRMSTHALKTAVLMAFDQHELDKPDGKISRQSAEAAIAFCRGVMRSASELEGRICETGDQRNRMKVLDCVRAYEKSGLGHPPRGVILQVTQLQWSKLRHVLESLQYENLIEVVPQSDGSMSYSYVGDSSQLGPLLS